MIPKYKDEHENEDTQAYASFPEVRELVDQLMSNVHGERLGRVIINRIPAGASIEPHPDTESHANYWDRFHIVIETNPFVKFYCEAEWVHMQAGSVWWFNNKLIHSVHNAGESDRTHIVVDIRCPSPDCAS